MTTNINVSKCCWILSRRNSIIFGYISRPLCFIKQQRLVYYIIIIIFAVRCSNCCCCRCWLSCRRWNRDCWYWTRHCWNWFKYCRRRCCCRWSNWCTWQCWMWFSCCCYRTCDYSVAYHFIIYFDGYNIYFYSIVTLHSITVWVFSMVCSTTPLLGTKRINSNHWYF